MTSLTCETRNGPIVWLQKPAKDSDRVKKDETGTALQTLKSARAESTLVVGLVRVLITMPVFSCVRTGAEDSTLTFVSCGTATFPPANFTQVW
ncbi:hypothetical protein BaRGS_00017023 [Batillaria attramentaria]|uniref:Ig-like domain-containing protein n=1 Tax=Batillaria attramentaria TaxID=370345 RepID=A0ABD0KXE5_9CAEN